MQRRKPPEHNLESPWSASLRKIGHHIQRRHFTEALEEASELLAQPDKTVHQKSRVLALVADCEFKRGRYAESAQIQLRAASNSLDHDTLWLRPHVGHVRALLKMPDVQQAAMMARHAVSLAESKMGEFNERVRQARQSVESNSAVTVPPVPPRISVVATRMGYLFLREGEPELAEEMFGKAIQAAKGGANRARQGLASIALAKGNFSEAAKISADAIRMGKFRAKTLPAWSSLIAARRQLGFWRISDRLIKGLDSAPAGLRARTIFTIASELRRNDMRQWRRVADDWLEKEGSAFPQYAKNLRKLYLADAKLEPENAAGRREAAKLLLETPELGARDWLIAAKEYMRVELGEGNPVDLDRLLGDAAEKYGEEFGALAAHGLALSCIASGRHDLARPLLQSNIRQCKPGRPQWCKSVWALARMEQKLDRHVEAARAYRQFFEAPGVPDRFRLQAQLKWAQQLILSGDANAFWDAHVLMTQTLAHVKDPETLMNFARQLQFGPSEFRPWGQEIYLQGETLALEQFNEATHPAVALDILHKLTRRQVLDFGRGSVAVELWESLDARKKDWLWSESALFWEYLSYLFAAFLQVGDHAGAEDFANDFLEDPASPPSGLPYLGIPCARHLIAAGRVDDGLALCERMATASPRHSLCAWAWYWLALKAWQRAEPERAKMHARNIRAAQGLQAGTLDGWRLDARALLILSDLEPARIDLAATPYSRSFMDEQRALVSIDLQKVSG